MPQPQFTFPVWTLAVGIVLLVVLGLMGFLLRLPLLSTGALSLAVWYTYRYWKLTRK